MQTRNLPLRVGSRSWNGFRLEWQNSSGSYPRLPDGPKECTRSTRRLLVPLELSLCPCLSRSKVFKFSFLLLDWLKSEFEGLGEVMSVEMTTRLLFPSR